MTESCERHGGGPSTADVLHNQSNSAPNGCTAAPTWTQCAERVIDIERIDIRTTDDDGRGDIFIRGLNAAKVKRRVRNGLYRCHNHREVLGLAACHHGIGGNFLYRCETS